MNGDEKMTEKMAILFASDYFNKNQVDEDLKNEYEAVIATGLYDVFLFSYDDWFNGGIIKLNKCPDEMIKTIYRGWMMTPDQYRKFDWDLREQNLDLVVNWWEYEKMHAFPNVYPEVAEDTPHMLVFPRDTKVDLGKIKNHFNRFKLKDYVKSVKGNKFPQFFTSDISEKEFSGWLDKFYQFRGDLFTGGICIKEYVDLKRYDGKTNEFRVYYVRGEVISICRNSLQVNTTPEPPEELILKYSHLNSPFYTIDYAEKEDGSWIIIETGDGQVSGLSAGQDYEAFYRALYHAATRDLEWRWCLVGNIVETREYGENREIRNGTKRFSGGTKVYIAPAQWGDGFENVVVLGKPRGRKGGLIEVVTDRKYIENYRIKKIFDPGVLRRIKNSEHSWWDNTDAARDCIKRLAESLNKEKEN